AGTTAGTSTITATDSAVAQSGTATLTESQGPATKVSGQLPPSAVPANVGSTSTAVAGGTDAHGNPVQEDAVPFWGSNGLTLHRPYGFPPYRRVYHTLRLSVTGCPDRRLHS